MESKKVQSLRLLKKNIEVLECPICQKSLEINSDSTITCSSNHTFDLSKKGYLNLLRHAPKENYERALFEARSQVIRGGLYGPLLIEIENIINDTFKASQDKILLDAGCGEGSHLNQISESLKNNQWNFFGLDIAKEGVALATIERKTVNWLVGDLSELPFKNESLDVILNILSPGHYQSFKRVLKTNGRVIKIIPTVLYLKEIRQALYPDKSYSHLPVETHFENNFTIVNKKTITYTFDVPNALKAKLLAMTPLTWKHNIDELLSLDLDTVTASFIILVGKK